ncbi:MAG TPA: HEAT repeat domain-containing protein [Bryobacteraceae bacterium]|nr:HEAT repeat domain-containing protein [Bryobacteraceae bacterium]
MILPSQYATADPIDLLRHAEQGLVGLDQRLMGALMARREATLAALSRFTSEPDTERLVDLTEQVFDLYRHFNSPQAASFYIGLLCESLDDTPDSLIEALAALGPAAVDPLLALHSSVESDDAADVVFVLAATGVRDERVAKLLLSTLATDPYAGALSIGLYGDPALAAPVQQALDALPESSAEDRKALADCLEALANASVEDRQIERPDILPDYPEAASPLFDYLDDDHLIEFLRCADPGCRHDAALSLVDADYPDSVLEALLGRAPAETDPQVRQAVLRALGERLDDDRIPGLLASVLSSEAEPLPVRAGALVALAQDPSNAVFRGNVFEFLASPATRAAALEAMWRSGDESYIPAFRTALRDEDLLVRIEAVHGVGSFPIPVLAIEMIPLFASEELREDALYSYASAVNAKITPKSVHRIFDEIEKKADGLSADEAEVVASALDRRLEIEGFEPVFHQQDAHDHDHDGCGHDHSHDINPALMTSVGQLDDVAVAQGKPAAKAGRNDPCPCGSGKKFKKCCGQ